MDATWGIAMLVVGLIVSAVATIGEGTLGTALSAGGFLLLVGGVVLLANASRR